MEEAAITGVGSEESAVPISRVKELELRIKRLERILGQKTEEVEILKEAIRIGREKKLISRKPLLKNREILFPNMIERLMITKNQPR
jgi:transposase